VYQNSFQKGSTSLHELAVQETQCYSQCTHYKKNCTWVQINSKLTFGLE